MKTKIWVFLIILLFASCAPRSYVDPELRRLQQKLEQLKRELELQKEREREIEANMWGKNNKEVIEPKPKTTPTPSRNKSSSTRTIIQAPSILKIWVVVDRGKVYAHRLKGFSYPGKVRKLEYKKSLSGCVVTFVSTYNPNIRWKALLPRDDGEYYIEAYREQ